MKMIITEFKKFPVPEDYQDILKVKSVFIIKYIIDLYGKPFEHGRAFKTKDEVKKFCDKNKISLEQLKSRWINGKNNGTIKN